MVNISNFITNDKFYTNKSICVKFEDMHYSLKDRLLDYVYRVELISTNEYKLYVSNDYHINKLLINDFVKFSFRSISQFHNFKSLNNLSSPSWRFVTLYYGSFFSMIALLRLYSEGLIYIDGNLAQYYNRFLDSIGNNNMILIQPGNYSIFYNELSQSIILKKINNGSVHEYGWNRIFDFYIPSWNNKNSENIFISALNNYKNILKKENCMPHTFRNNINYSDSQYANDFLNIPTFSSNYYCSSIDDYFPKSNKKNRDSLYFLILFLEGINTVNYSILEYLSETSDFELKQFFNRNKPSLFKKV